MQSILWKSFPTKSILRPMVFTKTARQRRNLTGLTHGPYTYVFIDDFFYFLAIIVVDLAVLLMNNGLLFLDQFS